MSRNCQLGRFDLCAFDGDKNKEFHYEELCYRVVLNIESTLQGRVFLRNIETLNSRDFQLKFSRLKFLKSDLLLNC